MAADGTRNEDMTLPEDLVDIDQLLMERRPIPSPVFRGEARRSLLSGESTWTERGRVRALIFGYAATGSLLLSIVGIGIVGIGPFAP